MTQSSLDKENAMNDHRSTTYLTFAQLRAANVARLPLFRNKHGGGAHTQPDGSDWTLGEWTCALAGEVGEAANIIKHIRRGDVTMDEARQSLADELADVQTYLDILAFRCDVDLAAATIRKFNEVSRRVGCSIYL